MVEIKIKQWGNSLGIVVPAKVARRLGLKEGKIVEIDIKENKKGTGFGILKDKKLKEFKKEIEEHEEFW